MTNEKIPSGTIRTVVQIARWRKRQDQTTEKTPSEPTRTMLDIEVCRTRRNQPDKGSGEPTLFCAELVDETWTASVKRRAMEQVAREGRIEEAVAAGEKAVYKAIAQTRPQPRVPFAVLRRAAEHGITLEEPKAELSEWAPEGRDVENKVPVNRDAVLMTVKMKPTTAAALALAARAAGREKQLLLADERYAGIGWYDALPRVDAVEINISDGGRRWKAEQHEGNLTKSSRIVERIEITLRGSERGRKPEEQRMLWRMDGVIAFGQTAEEVAKGIEPLV